jgi:hypothetical protein
MNLSSQVVDGFLTAARITPPQSAMTPLLFNNFEGL